MLGSYAERALETRARKKSKYSSLQNNGVFFKNGSEEAISRVNPLGARVKVSLWEDPIWPTGLAKQRDAGSGLNSSFCSQGILQPTEPRHFSATDLHSYEANFDRARAKRCNAAGDGPDA